ncbi:oligosaccharide biosynthesis protein Alg14 like-domain-containing protein [Xylariaceae sp. FL0594]|nr:oligosaccharide biosynthesis protein Alg14 like-domain-containing protein [Xylariaceae sp. FL0594]
MNTNRDQAVQQAIGGSIFDIIKNGILLGCALVMVILVTHHGLNIVAKHHANTAIMTTVGALMLIAAYLVLVRGTRSVVCVQSAHYVILICGSGGHTAEMIQMVERSVRPEKLSHRRWAVGKDDEKSYLKVLAFERRLLDRFSHHDLDSGTFDIVRFGRARYVHQSWLTTPLTAVLSLLDIIHILTDLPRQCPVPETRYPGVIVTNGPGTGFLFLAVARLLKLLRLVPASHMRSIYVESWARVKSLSLTGKLIQKGGLADTFIVQYRSLVGQKEILAENLLVMPPRPVVPIDYKMADS